MFISFHSNSFLPYTLFFWHPVSQKHNMHVFVHLKQAEETSVGPRRSTPPCACVTSLTQAVCVCSCFNGPPGPSGLVQAACSLAHSLSPPAVTVGHDTRSHTHVIWCGFSRISLHILFALKTEFPTTHTLHFLSHFITLLSSVWRMLECDLIAFISLLTGMRFWSAVLLRESEPSGHTPPLWLTLEASGHVPTCWLTPEPAATLSVTIDLRL